MLNIIFRAASKCTHKICSDVRLYSMKAAPINLKSSNPALLYKGRTATQVLEELPEEDLRNFLEIKSDYEARLLNAPHTVPTEVSNDKWLEILKLTSFSARVRFYQFLIRTQAIKSFDLVRKKKTKDRENTVAINSLRMFQRLTKSTINRSCTRKMHNALLWGQPLVFDLSFEEYMRSQDTRNLAKQLQYCYAMLKVHRDPFHMVLANLDPDSDQCHYVKHAFTPNPDPKFDLKNLPFTVSSKSYQELYPDQRFVYLSPDATSELKDGEWDHNAIYIVGGLVDKAIVKPFTYAKARREGIESRRIPLDSYVTWMKGHKSLTLDVLLKILLMAKESNGDWGTAIRSSVSKRSLTPQVSTESRRLKRLLHNI